MVGDRRKGCIWNQLVMPILWPVAIAQLVLLLLGLGFGLGGGFHWMFPETDSWAPSLLLLIGLVAGTMLNLLIFLMLFRHRVDSLQWRMEGCLDRVDEKLAQRCAQVGVPWPKQDQFSLVARLLNAVKCVEQLLCFHDRHQSPSSDPVAPLSSIEPMLHDEIQRLSTALGRARNESRLKSSYLAHIAGSLVPVIEQMESSAWLQLTDDDELRRRLLDVGLLLENFDNREVGGADDLAAPTARVLIVDDGPVNLMLARQVLERKGLGVITAISGGEALELLQTHAVELVLMDIVLPDIDGIEVCRRLRALEAALPQRQKAAVIALTANASEQDRQRFRESGMDGVLAKPYRPQALLETVESWLVGGAVAPQERG